MPIEPNQVEPNPEIDRDKIYMIAPRRYSIDFRDGKFYIIWEPEIEWAKRCSVIYGVKLP